MKLLSKIKTVCSKRYFASSCRGASRVSTTLLGSDTHTLLTKATSSRQQKKDTTKRNVPVATRRLASSALCIALILSAPATAFGAITAPTYSTVDNAISRTSVAVSGSGAGIVFVAGDDGSDSINSVTWNGVAMTKINASSLEVPGDRFISAWCIQDPASSATIAFNDNTDNYWRNANAFYPGAACPEDSENGGTSSGVTSISVATTVVDADSWLIAFHKDGSGGKTYTPSNAVTTMHINADAGGLAIADSNGAVGSGSKTATLTAVGNANHAMIAFSLAPASAPAASSFQLWSLSTF